MSTRQQLERNPLASAASLSESPRGLAASSLPLHLEGWEQLRLVLRHGSGVGLTAVPAAGTTSGGHISRVRTHTQAIDGEGSRQWAPCAGPCLSSDSAAAPAAAPIRSPHKGCHRLKEVVVEARLRGVLAHLQQLRAQLLQARGCHRRNRLAWVQGVGGRWQTQRVGPPLLAARRLQCVQTRLSQTTTQADACASAGVTHPQRR